MLITAGNKFCAMSDVDTDTKREEEIRREEDERLDTAEDEHRGGDDATEEVRRAMPPRYDQTITARYRLDARYTYCFGTLASKRD